MFDSAGLTIPAFVFFGLLAGTGLIGFFALTAARRQRREAARHRAEAGSLRRSIQMLEQQNGMLLELEHEKEDLTLFFVLSLPDLIHQLNANRDRREIAPLLVRMLALLFEPRQGCVLYCSRDADHLRVAACQGLPIDSQKNKPVQVPARGLVAQVAKHQVVMSSQDMSATSSFASRGRNPGHGLQVDLCAPLIDPDEKDTVGVVTVGGLTKNHRYEKQLIKMVVDLGSFALKNTEYYRRVRTLANQDGLTLLYNKRFGTDQLSMAMNDAERSGRDLSILLFDIDYFKNYNDTNGHVAGDEALRRIGEIVHDALRADDFAVRFGGEEFLIVFKDVNKQGALVASEKLRRLIEENPFTDENRQPGGKLTISGGVASFRTDSRISTELIRLADEALYRAKKEGRNRILAHRAAYISGETEPETVSPTR
ncbi:MAG: GGDEF domain-containing protein [Acidobacteriota bacterium]